jgi:hypothetical protein
MLILLKLSVISFIVVLIAMNVVEYLKLPERRGLQAVLGFIFMASLFGMAASLFNIAIQV